MLGPINSSFNKMDIYYIISFNVFHVLVYIHSLLFSRHKQKFIVLAGEIFVKQLC